MKQQNLNKINFIINIILTVILCPILLTACGHADNSVALATDTQVDTETIQDTAQYSGNIYVYVKGEVESPGVYCVGQDARVYQVIEMAGGMTDKACAEDLNLAETLCDGEEIQILSRKQYKAAQQSQAQTDGDVGTAGAKDGDADKIDINTATAQQLMELPGIGAAKAAAIVAYREEHGAFSSAEALSQVSGIGEATVAKIKAMITVN